MTTTDSIDPYIASALKLLHSSASDSAEKLRTMLDNEILKHHDKSKLISNLLTKKQISDEKSAPGSGFKKQKPKKTEELKVVRAPTPEIIPIIDDDSSPEEKKSEADDAEEMDYTDFTCITCGQIDSSANNQLFECIECHLLHHQLCHIPKISSDTNLTSWICSTCKGKKEKEGSSKSTKSYESSSSSCSSSSRHKKPVVKSSSSEKEKKVEVSKKKGKESSSSSSSSRSRSSKK